MHFLSLFLSRIQSNIHNKKAHHIPVYVTEASKHRWAALEEETLDHTARCLQRADVQARRRQNTTFNLFFFICDFIPY